MPDAIVWFYIYRVCISVTPRDSRRPDQQSKLSHDQNFRFKGYPDKNFEQSKHPITGLAPDETELQGIKLREIQGSELYSRKQYFDTRQF